MNIEKPYWKGYIFVNALKSALRSRNKLYLARKAFRAS
jgi:hypothetical protein